MTVIVTGGRFYGNGLAVNKVLSHLDVDLIVHGACTGADLLCKEWADDNGIKHKPFPAKWGVLGDAAGPIRNGEMLDAYPGALVVAFPGDRGTKNCVAQALKKGHIVLEVRTP